MGVGVADLLFLDSLNKIGSVFQPFEIYAPSVFIIAYIFLVKLLL